MCWAAMTAEDSARIRGLLRAAGIKGTVKVGRGSLAHTVRVRTDDPRVVQVVEAGGYRFNPDDSWPERKDWRFGRILWQRGS